MHFSRYHESSQMSSLVETFVSKASALQRQGRAGRVRDGFCFRMYTRERYVRPSPGWGDTQVGERRGQWWEVMAVVLFPRFEGFMEYSVPEILRVPLEELCLHIMVIPQERRSVFYSSPPSGKEIRPKLTFLVFSRCAAGMNTPSHLFIKRPRALILPQALVLYRLNTASHPTPVVLTWGQLAVSTGVFGCQTRGRGRPCCGHVMGRS